MLGWRGAFHSDHSVSGVGAYSCFDVSFGSISYRFGLHHPGLVCFCRRCIECVLSWCVVVWLGCVLGVEGPL